MPYFLSVKNLSLNQEFDLEGDEAAHLLVSRRLKIGEKIKLQGPDEQRFLCEVVGVEKRKAVVLAREKVEVPPEPSRTVALYQSVVSQKTLDLIFQKAVELQAGEVVVLNSQNTAARLSRKKFEEKKQHWEKVFWEAAKQCERVRPPRLTFYNSLSDSLESLRLLDKVVLLDPQSQNKFKSLNIISAKTLGLLVGPEGGFTQEEVQKILGLPNAVGVNLGEVLLRAETAAISVLALAQNI